MRIHRALHQLVMRFSGLEEAEGTELYAEATIAYKECLISAQSKTDQNNKIGEKNRVGAGVKDYKEIPLIKLTKEEQAIMFLERWPTRYGIAIVYIILVPKIKQYYEGGADDDEGMDQMDPMQFMQFASMFSKFQNFQKK